MASIVTDHQTFRYLLRARTLCLGLLVLLFWVGEGNQTSSIAVEVGWDILLLAMALSLVFVALGGIRRITWILIPAIMVLDTFLTGIWVSASGGPVSNYTPIFILILASALMILPPKRAAWVVAWVLVIALTTLYLDFSWRLPLVFEAGEINPFSGILEKSSFGIPPGGLFPSGPPLGFLFGHDNRALHGPDAPGVDAGRTYPDEGKGLGAKKGTSFKWGS